MNKIIRCAIYTRKSTEEGLEQDFNSLDAQREAGESYIKSQKHEGWEILLEKYDDGGYSGGNIERPGLKQLMADIAAGKIDIVVVYKVDRLSRSLCDFAKLIEIFDTNKVSFVSVTQQFNTTTSMGRLTLNILLSFAQFEREVTGERIRDKFRASKEKGMWMGGFIPLGYNVKNRKLLVNEKEAELVKYIFSEYLKLGSVDKLRRKLEREGYRNKSWITAHGKPTGGGALSKMALYAILANLLYIGKVAHKNKGKVYDGQHAAIIDKEFFNKVQKKISSYRSPNSGKMQPTKYLLQGKCYDINNKLFTTTYTKKLSNSKSYGYYHNVHTNHRIGKAALDKIVIQAIQSSLVEERCWLEFLSDSPLLHRQQILYKLQQLIWNFNTFPHNLQLSIGKQIIERVTILNNSIAIRVSKNLDTLASHEIASPTVAPPIGDLIPDLNMAEDYLEITVPISFKQCGKRKIAFDQSGKVADIIQEDRSDMTMIKALTKSYRWNKLLESGEAKSITEIAALEGLDRCRVAKIINLIFLPPKMVTSILSGTQDPNLRMHHLLGKVS